MLVDTAADVARANTFETLHALRAMSRHIVTWNRLSTQGGGSALEINSISRGTYRVIVAFPRQAKVGGRGERNKNIFFFTGGRALNFWPELI